MSHKMGTDWIIGGELSKRNIPESTTNLPYGKAFNSTDFQFLDGLLRELQKEKDLVEGVNLIIEFTPTTSDYNEEYLDRSHIAIAYDDNRFRFDIAIKNAVPEAENRVSKLVKLVEAWTGISSGGLEAGLKRKIKAEFPAIKEKAESYDSAVRAILEEERKGVFETTDKVIDLLKANKILIPNEEDYRRAIQGQYHNHFYSLKSKAFKNLDKEHPNCQKIILPFESEKGLLDITVRYRIKHYCLGTMDESRILGEYDAVFAVDGKLEKPEFNLSLEAIHEAGFQGIRDIYWRVPKEEKWAMCRTDGANRGTIYNQYPHLEVSFNRSVIDACGDFRKSKNLRVSKDYYHKIRERFNFGIEYGDVQNLIVGGLVVT